MKLKFRWENHTVTNRTVRVPYGWTRSDHDYNHFIVDYEMVPYIQEALQQVENGKSLRDAAAWLTLATNKPISHVGVNILWDKVVIDNENTDRQARLDTWKKPKTREEKKARRLVERKAHARRQITRHTKSLKRLEGNENGTIDDLAGEFARDLVQDTEDEREIVFKPNPGPQEEFLEASDQEVLYGGAAGGGKSYAILADPMRYFYHPQFSGLLIRRTMDELRDLIRESLILYKKWDKRAKFNAQTSTWTFPSGARLWMSYLDRDSDVEKYRGQAYSWIGIDELTHYATPYAWDFLRSRLRTTAKDLPLCMRATTNPGGPGHGWVKKAFIDPAPPNTSFIPRDFETGKPLVFPTGHAKAGQPLFTRKFIPAKLKDNPYLYDDGQYEASLLSLNEHQRRQLLNGDWTIADGAAFPEFSREVHTCAPFDIPHEWRRFRSCDYGYSSFAAVLWFAIDPVWDRLIVYRELYVTKHTGAQLAARIREIEEENREYISYGILDSSVFHQRGNSGPAISEEMAAEGVRFRPSDRGAGSRVAGRNRLHELLRIDDLTGQGGIIIFNNCRQLIADLEVIPTDPKGGDDIDDRFVSDHTYDALRYGIMSRPKPYGLVNEWGGQVATRASPKRPSDPTFGY